MAQQIRCDCGAKVDSRGLASHLRGNDHDVAMCLNEQAGLGNDHVSAQYVEWIRLAGFPRIVGPVRWHAGSRGSRGSMTHGHFVPAIVARWLKNSRIPAKIRKSVLLQIGKLPPAERDALLDAAFAADALGGDVAVFFAHLHASDAPQASV